MAKKPWKPSLATIRQRNKEFLQHSREACVNGEFMHTSGLVFLEVEHVLQLLDRANRKLAEAGVLGERDAEPAAPETDLTPDEEGDDEESPEPTARVTAGN